MSCKIQVVSRKVFHKLTSLCLPVDALLLLGELSCRELPDGDNDSRFVSFKGASPRGDLSPFTGDLYRPNYANLIIILYISGYRPNARQQKTRNH